MFRERETAFITFVLLSTNLKLPRVIRVTNSQVIIIMLSMQ